MSAGEILSSLVKYWGENLDCPLCSAQDSRGHMHAAKCPWPTVVHDFGSGNRQALAEDGPMARNLMADVMMYWEKLPPAHPYHCPLCRVPTAGEEKPPHGGGCPWPDLVDAVRASS